MTKLMVEIDTVTGLISAVAAPVAPTLVRKTADESLTNNNNLQNDDELVLPVAANGVWEVFCLMRVTSGACGYKFAWAIPAGATIRQVTAGLIGILTTAVILPASADGTVAIGASATYTDAWVMIWAIYIGAANAGNLQLQWACNAAATGTTCTVLANSYIKAHKLS